MATAAPLDIHPGVLENMEGVDDDNRSYIEGAVKALKIACDGLEAIQAARVAAEGDASMTEVGRTLEVAALADKEIAKYHSAYDSAHEVLRRQIAFTEAELAKPLQVSVHANVAGEIRALARSMSAGERQAMLREAIADSDTTILSAMLAGHPRLTGLTKVEVETFTQLWNRKSQPQLASRLAVMQRVFAYLGEHGHTMARHAQKHIGKPPHEVALLRAASAKRTKAFAR